MEKFQILLLDDDDSLRFNLEMYLLDEGFSVKAVPNAEQALEFVKSNNIYVAIVDIRLPGIDGEEFIKKAYQVNPFLNFLIHTGSTKYILPKELTDIGMTENDVFIKPLSDLTNLTNRIHSLIKNK